MAIDFPASPTNGQVFTSGDKTWVYSTSVTAWNLQTQLATLDNLSDVVITTPATTQYVRYNGTNWVNATIVAGDVPTLNQNTTGTAATVTGAAQTAITSVGTLSALRVDGNFGIGINGLAQTGLRIRKDISGSAYAQGIILDGTIQPSVTSRSDTVWSNPSVAASVTLPEIKHFYASSPAIGTGSTITAVTGFKAESNLGNNYSGTVTNVYAFSGNINSGTGRWNFFANGTANNYMAGRLGVGLAVTSGAMAQVVNTTAADKAFIIRGAASQSGDFLDVQNSGGTSQFKVDASGNLFVASNPTTGDANTKIGWGRTGNGYSYIDLIGDATYTNYGLRLLRGNTGANAASELLHRGTGNFQFTLVEAAPILFSTTNTERMRITSAGLVGIGTTTPAEKLTIANGNANITNGTLSIARTAYPLIELNQSGSTGVGQIAMNGNDLEIRQTQAFNMKLYTANTERMRIDSSGHVSIGATPLVGRSFLVGKPLTGGLNSYGIVGGGTVQSDVTSTASQFLSAGNTAAAAFTLGNYAHFYAFGVTTPGAGSTITTQNGFLVS